MIRAGGKIFEVTLNEGRQQANEHQTSLTASQNVEGLCFDGKNNRLLLTIKDEEPGNPGYKEIYEFRLSDNIFNESPVFKIDLEHELFGTAKKNL